MKNLFKITALMLLLALMLCACNKAPETELVGSWYTEQNGVRLTVIFGDDGVMSTFCTITDKAAADAAGVNPDIVESKNISCVYKLDADPDTSGLKEDEQKILAGKKAIHSYLNAEDMENGLSGETIYYTLSGDTLTTTQQTGRVDSQTGIPLYSETTFTKNK